MKMQAPDIYLIQIPEIRDVTVYRNLVEQTLSIFIQVPKSANFRCPSLSRSMLSGFTSLKIKIKLEMILQINITIYMI